MSEKEATEEREVSEKEIDDKLNIIIENDFTRDLDRLFAKLIFNLRFDLNELKIELIKTLKNIEEPEEEEYIPTSEEDLKKIEAEPGRFYNDFYA